MPASGRVLAEVTRVPEPGGVAVLVTPNGLPFARPDGIMDPYHFVKYDPGEAELAVRAALPPSGRDGTSRS